MHPVLPIKKQLRLNKIVFKRHVLFVITYSSINTSLMEPQQC